MNTGPDKTNPILTVEDVNKTFDGFKAITNLNFYLTRGELRTVIGPNGAGKSTFFCTTKNLRHLDLKIIQADTNCATSISKEVVRLKTRLLSTTETSKRLQSLKVFLTISPTTP